MMEKIESIRVVDGGSRHILEASKEEGNCNDYHLILSQTSNGLIIILSHFLLRLELEVLSASLPSSTSSLNRVDSTLTRRSYL